MTPFGAYALERKVGQGGMAEVFLARAFGASGFEKRVVLKLLKEELLGQPSLERMFFEEARLQAQLRHRNLVQAHDCGVVQGRPYVRLDWVDGVDLSAIPGPLPQPLALRIAVELALGLHALHEAVDFEGRPLGVVHRDVSPRNVLVSRLGEVKLGDFGIARATLLRDQTRAGVRKGTYAYMSPEQVAGKPLTAASDQFSLATLLMELLINERPFDGATPLETMDRIREAELPSGFERIDAPVRSVLKKALAKKANDRFISSRALRAALMECGPVADELELADALPKEGASQERPPTTVD